MSREIYADYDDSGIYIYQAFKTETVQAALAKGTFGKGFSLERMTWIKPSFGWMLHRSGYATSRNQEAILKIKLSHAGFLAILAQSIETSFNTDLYPSQADWKKALDASDVRHQWDPDREIGGKKLTRRAIQIGIKGETVYRYVNEWIIGLDEVTALAHAIEQAMRARRPLPIVPIEKVYPVDNDLKRRLGMTIEI